MGQQFGMSMAKNMLSKMGGNMPQQSAAPAAPVAAAPVAPAAPVAAPVAPRFNAPRGGPFKDFSQQVNATRTPRGQRPMGYAYPAAPAAPAAQQQSGQNQSIMDALAQAQALRQSQQSMPQAPQWQPQSAYDVGGM